MPPGAVYELSSVNLDGAKVRINYVGGKDFSSSATARSLLRLTDRYCPGIDGNGKENAAKSTICRRSVELRPYFALRMRTISRPTTRRRFV